MKVFTKGVLRKTVLRNRAVTMHDTCRPWGWKHPTITWHLFFLYMKALGIGQLLLSIINIMSKINHKTRSGAAVPYLGLNLHGLLQPSWVFCLAETRISFEVGDRWFCQFWSDLGMIYDAPEGLYGYNLRGNACKVTLSHWEWESCKGRGEGRYARELKHARG